MSGFGADHLVLGNQLAKAHFLNIELKLIKMLVIARCVGTRLSFQHSGGRGRQISEFGGSALPPSLR